MKDTKAYIREMKRKLPDIRERLIAVLVLLTMSVVMMASTTFAWVVLSTKPEVEGISLAISGNGNLEIALRNTNNVPGFSQVGDSVAAGTAIKDANITWGNLINLSEGYGLDTLVLRPARLNKGGLVHGRPLEGVLYGQDGRVEGMQSDYAFTVWKEGLAGGSFVSPTDASKGYGVRAISSMTYTYEGESALLLKKYQDDAVTANGNARSAHVTITDKNGPYMDTIVKLMGDFMTWTVNSGDYSTNESRDCSNYVVPLVWLLRDMKAGLEQHGNALVNLVNAWQYNKDQDQATMMTYEQMMQGKFPEGFNASGYAGYAAFKADYDLLKSTMTKLNSCLTSLTNTFGEIAERQDNMQPWKIEGAHWGHIGGVVNEIVHVSTCVVKDKNYENDKQVGEITGASQATSYLSGTNTAVIHKGLLVDYEHLTGEEMLVSGVSVSVTIERYGVAVPASVKANVVTKWNDPDPENASAANEIDLFTQNQNAMRDYLQENMSVKDAIAGDTFGLVLDLWARTNAPGSILGLNGTIITRTETREVKEIIEGVTYQMYSLEMPAAEGEDPVTLKLYQKDDIWYNFEDHKAVDVGTQVPMPMMETVDVVIEYNGDNRIWEEDELLINPGATSTTQGSGSCYIYYADSPEAGLKSLELLKNLKIAFISGDNKYLATASMDTEHVLQQNGKYTVPLVITDSTCSYVDENGDMVKGIMHMPQNQAVMISAIVYLDGEELKNEHVLAASDIQGSLSIQFNSSALMDPIDDLKLMEEEIRVSATLGTGQKELNFEYRYPFNQQVAVNLTVDGFTPQNAEAFFQRQISETQGSRMEAFPIDLNTGKGIATFTSPGTYILRYVRLDGVEYELEEPLKVNVSGFAVDSVQVGQSYFMTADQSATTSVSVNFGALDADELPHTVQARFMTETGSAINVKLRPNTNGVWVGDVTFNSSGIYRLEYLVLDGQYSELVDEQVRVVEARLGMSTEVVIRRYLSMADNTTTSDLRFTYEGQKVNFKAYVKIKDDSGTYLNNLDTGVAGALKLYYKTTGSVGGISADLKWDASYGGYATESEGFFVDAPGTYRFDQVTVNGNSITSAYPSPVISAMYPDPPTWTAVQFYESNQQEVFAPNSDAYATVHITNAGTEKAWLVFEDASGKLYESQVVNPETDIDEVLDADGNRIAHSYKARLPLGADGTQAGVWKLVAVKMADVNDGKGGVATVDKPYVLNLSKEEQIRFTVGVDDFTLVFNEEGNVAQQVIELSNGTFMSEQKISELYAWLIQTGSDGSNHYAVTGSNIKLTFSYVRSEGNTDYMYAWGGYTPVGDVTVADVEVLLQVHDTGSYRMWQSGAFTAAGKYVLKSAVLTIPGTGGAEDKVYTHVVGATEGNNLGIVADTNRAESILPEIHVKSALPTVKISNVTPNTSEEITVNVSADPDNGTDILKGAHNYISDDRLTATVYIHNTNVSNSQYTYTAPSVELTVSNLAAFTTATVVFPNAENSSYNRTYTFAPDGLVNAQEIGYAASPSRNDPTPELVFAGNQTATHIQVTAADGNKYDVELTDAVTINQPQHPVYLAYSISGGNFNGTVPTASFASGDGTVLKAKFPSVAAWNDVTETDEKRNEAYSSVTKVDMDYWEIGCNDTFYYIKQETRYYTYELKAVGTTYQVTGWTLNGVPYKPGDEITLTASQTAVAEIANMGSVEQWNGYRVTQTRQSGKSKSNSGSRRDAYELSLTYDENWSSGSPERVS